MHKINQKWQWNIKMFWCQINAVIFNYLFCLSKNPEKSILIFTNKLSSATIFNIDNTKKWAGKSYLFIVQCDTKQE